MSGEEGSTASPCDCGVGVPPHEHVEGGALMFNRKLTEAELSEVVRRFRSPDLVNHPPHYTWLPGVEVIDITENLGFCLGNVVKYVLRADAKGDPLTDLRKARWYLDREIQRRERAAAAERNPAGGEA